MIRVSESSKEEEEVEQKEEQDVSKKKISTISAKVSFLFPLHLTPATASPEAPLKFHDPLMAGTAHETTLPAASREHCVT